MRKFFIFVLLFLLSTALYAYSDSDMDGVDDKVDKCPNTPFMELVDINGCTIKKLAVLHNNPHHFDIIIGANYTGSNFTTAPATNTYSSSLQIDYYYKDFSLQASTSYYTTDGDSYSANGLNDSFIGAAYMFHFQKALTLRLSAGALLPTYNSVLGNNNTDYTASLNLSYLYKKINLFAGYIYTIVNDDDVTVTLSNGTQYNYEYKNTNAYSIGSGYYLSNSLYMSIAYNNTQSVYKGIDDAKSVSLYAYYGINRHWFMNFSYAYGLNDVASDHAASIKLGYYF